MSETLRVTKRESRGKRNARRQRAAGTIPGILYGHGKEAVSLSIKASEIRAAIRHGSRVVDLAGDVTDQVLIREVQWDTFGADLLHVDLTRVSADETITVDVQIELRGDAPGTKQGGVVEHLVHEVEIECLAQNIPEKLEININNLMLGESLAVSDLELPPSVKVNLSDDTVLVQCVEPQAEFELEEGEPSTAEPEIIGRSGWRGGRSGGWLVLCQAKALGLLIEPIPAPRD